MEIVVLSFCLLLPYFGFIYWVFSIYIIFKGVLRGYIIMYSEVIISGSCLYGVTGVGIVFSLFPFSGFIY